MDIGRRHSHFIVTLIVSAAYIACALSSAAGVSAAPPNIVLITLDTTRADRMGFLGSKLGLTPNLDRLAQDSSIFTRAYAVVPLTTASHAAILSGTFPEFSGVNDFGKPLPSAVPYLPALLRAGEYRTAAFVGCRIRCNQHTLAQRRRRTAADA